MIDKHVIWMSGIQGAIALTLAVTVPMEGQYITQQTSLARAGQSPALADGMQPQESVDQIRVTTGSPPPQVSKRKLPRTRSDRSRVGRKPVTLESAVRGIEDTQFKRDIRIADEEGHARPTTPRPLYKLTFWEMMLEFEIMSKKRSGCHGRRRKKNPHVIIKKLESY